jgi:phage-related protein
MNRRTPRQIMRESYKLRRVNTSKYHFDDENKKWRIVYRIDDDAIVILEIFEKKTQKTPKNVIDNCKRRIRLYESL